MRIENFLRDLKEWISPSSNRIFDLSQRDHEIDINMFVEFPAKIFKVTQLDFDHLKGSESFSVRMKKLAIFIFNVWNILTYSALVIIVLLRSHEVVFGISLALTFMMIVIRYTSYFFSRFEIAGILESLRKEYPSERTYADILKKYMKEYKRFEHLYSMSVPVPFTLSFLDTFVRYMFMNERIFSPKMYFPFNATDPKVYPFVITWVYVAEIIISILNFSDLTLLFGILACISMRFEVLAEKFKDLKIIADKSLLRGIIKQLNEEHIMLLDITSKMNKIFSLSFFFSLIMSSVSMCFLAFEASISNRIDHVFFYSNFIALTLFTMFLQCYYGQKIKDTSSKIAYGVIECGWEGMTDNKLKKDLLFIMMRAQRVTKLTVLSFGDVTFELYATVSMK
ncbi:putative odorant receptor 92a [Chironomus tepperi]|uniref:putative odorant receptor 92a n=1 Tax=Chironomus tepperi TaxID=113505 RepID=UPI00391F527B